jgi:hypothetical protein
MKTLTTFAALAALIVGMSVAGAQTPPPSNSGAMQAQPSSNQPQVRGKDPFCVVTAPGSLNCRFASLQDCQKDPKLRSRPCVANPGAGTTGAK